MHAARNEEPSCLLFDPLAIIGILNEHGVRFVVIGGIAAGVQGAMWATTDLDITYARDRVDLARLASALEALGAEPIELPAGVRVRLDGRSLRAGNVWTLSTRFGRLDLLGEPAPGLDYDAMSSRARTIRGAQTYLVATIDDLIAMKRAAGRQLRDARLGRQQRPGLEPDAPGALRLNVGVKRETFDRLVGC